MKKLFALLLSVALLLALAACSGDDKATTGTTEPTDAT